MGTNGNGITITKTLRVRLSPDERASRGEAFATAYEQIAKTKAEAKRIAEDFATKIKSLQADAARLARDVREGTEDRPVECREEPDYRSNAMITIRTDTGEKIDSRPLSIEERQEPLPLDGEGGNKAARRKREPKATEAVPSEE